MRIQNITFNPISNNYKNQKLKNTPYNYSIDNTYNPISYRPISFTSRLFRSPENFYAQPFNQSGMPNTMKDYLYADFSDRQKMPPNQMMTRVFEDLKYAETLDQVKEIFPNEPLFQDLTNIPRRKVRTGIIGDLKILKEENSKPLFKDGSDDLGLYILKKIYIEGKTLKEINTDFKNDALKEYSGLLNEIDYTTLSAYGIKYPKPQFWHSFYANRENFPYTYTPRKDYTRKDAIKINSHDITPTKPVERKQKYKIDDKNLKKISDSLIYGEGNALNTKRALKNRNVNNEYCNFLFKYIKPIMSVATEKIHLSEILAEFYSTNSYGLENADYSNLTHRQGQALDIFWKNNPDLKEEFSKSIKETLKLFTEEYQDNPQNEDFKSLLKYADSIKPERERLKLEHDAKQKEYDELFANEKKVEDPFTKLTTTLDNINKSLDKLENKVEESIKGSLAESLDLDYSPNNFSKLYINFFMHHSLNTKDFQLKLLGLNKSDTEMSEEIADTFIKILNDFFDRYKKNILASEVAMYKMFHPKGENSEKFFYGNALRTNDIVKKSLKDRPLTNEERNSLNKLYIQLASGTMSNKDIIASGQKIINLVYDQMLEDNPKNFAIKIPTFEQGFKAQLKQELAKSGILKEYGTCPACLLDKNCDSTLAKAIARIIYANLKEIKK